MAAAAFRIADDQDIFPFSLILSALDLLKVCLWMFADRADEIIRQFFADPFIAADTTAPDGFSLGSCHFSLRPGLDL
jgi:hypothetical protein